MEFDQYSQNYDAALIRGVWLSGETPEYFAQMRVSHLRNSLRCLGKDVRSILEFGCGTGNNIPFLKKYFPQSQITGVDISEECLERAKRRFLNDSTIRFAVVNEPLYQPFDMVFVNGVFHHIPVEQQAYYLEKIRSFLKKRAMLALFENNPFSLGARLVMKRIPFDQNAVMVKPAQLVRMIKSLGFDTISVRYYFIFPRFLGWFRSLERFAERIPVGAQYCVYARNC